MHLRPFATTEADRPTDRPTDGLTANFRSLANANYPTAAGSGLTSSSPSAEAAAAAAAAAMAAAVRAKRGGGGGDHSAWPVKRSAEIAGGDLVIGGLHMVHEREEALTCGPVMPQGGLQGPNSAEIVVA